jgi:hypothetical protein
MGVPWWSAPLVNQVLTEATRAVQRRRQREAVIAILAIVALAWWGLRR